MNKTYFKENKFLILILLVATFLRFYKLDFQSLWMDEIYTLNVASSNHSFSQIITEVNLRESFPYLYFFLINTVLSLFGDSSLAARIPSVIIGIAAVWMMYKLGKELYSKNVGLIAASLFTLNEFAIYHSQEARAYSLYLLCLLFSYYRFVFFIKSDTNRNMYLYAISAGLLLNSNFFSVLNVLTHGAILVYILLNIEKVDRKIYFNKLLIIAGIILLFFIPNAYKFYLLSQFKSSWIPAPSNDGITNVLKEFIGASEILIFIYGVLFTYFFVKVFNHKKTKTINEIIANKLVFNYLIIFSWISILIVILVSKSYLSSSLYVSRYFISVFPAIILIISISFEQIKNIQIRATLLSFLLFFLAFDLIVVKKYYEYPKKTQFKEASQLIIDKNKNDEVVYTSLKYWFDFYLNNNGVQYNVIEKPNLDAVINEMMADSTRISPFWYIDAHGRPIMISEIQQEFINKHFYVDESFNGLDAWTKHFILIKNSKKITDISKFSPLQSYNGSSFAYAIESLENNNKIVTIKGWAYFEDQDATESVIDILLIKDGKSTNLFTQKASRPDVTSYFKSKYDLSNSGFLVTFNLSELEAGQYSVAVYLENKTSKKVGLNISDKIIIKND